MLWNDVICTWGGQQSSIFINIGSWCIYRQDVLFSYFFFQAEDGIRDLTVTGVQTCALPISSKTMPSICGPPLATLTRSPTSMCSIDPAYCDGDIPARARVATGTRDRSSSSEIGRASCRERV